MTRESFRQTYLERAVEMEQYALFCQPMLASTQYRLMARNYRILAKHEASDALKGLHHNPARRPAEAPPREGQ